MSEIRSHSYLNKASILHIDRRNEFKRKLLEKENSNKENEKNNAVRFNEKF